MTDKNHTKFEEKELRFRQTLSALPDGVVLLRKDLVIQWMNRIAERDLSLDPEKDVGKKLTDVFTNLFSTFSLNAGKLVSLLIFPTDEF